MINYIRFSIFFDNIKLKKEWVLSFGSTQYNKAKKQVILTIY